jgi:guanylate kinase
MFISITAPSGTGKNSVIEVLLSRMPDLLRSVSCTTRPPRPGEIDGVHYRFISREDFEEGIRRGMFYEWAEYGGHLYGTPASPLEEALKDGRDVIAALDVQGAMKVKGKMPDAVLIFLLPPSMEELERRLRGRGTESEEMISLRLKRAEEEIGMIGNFDYAVVNDKVEEAASKIASIIEAERLRVCRMIGGWKRGGAREG